LESVATADLRNKSKVCSRELPGHFGPASNAVAEFIMETSRGSTVGGESWSSRDLGTSGGTYRSENVANDNISIRTSV